MDGERRHRTTGWCCVAKLLTVVLLMMGAEPDAAWGQSDSADWTTRQGRYLRLITDLPDSPACDQWVAAFDAAVPQWLDYWGRDETSLSDWRVTVYVIADRTKFQRAGYLPDSLPPFEHGFQRRDQIWIYHQNADYYNRHLLLHEGSHALAWHLFGELGPPWFAEGTAEWLGTHRWPQTAEAAASARPTVPDGFEVGIVPANRQSAGGWGRIELIRDQAAAGQVPSFLSVMQLDDTAHRSVQSYAWSWLAMLLCESYPEYQRALRAQLPTDDNDRSRSLRQLNRRLFGELRGDWQQLTARWSLLALDIDYGWQAEHQRFAWPRRLPPKLTADSEFSLATNRGWQPTPVRLEAGQTVELTASGRYLLRQKPAIAADYSQQIIPHVAGTADRSPTAADQTISQRPWHSEADGITIQHYRGRPLGQLIACLLPVDVDPNAPYLPQPTVVAVGSSSQLTASGECLLLLKINEPPGEYGDNQGQLEIRVQPMNR